MSIPTISSFTNGGSAGIVSLSGYFTPDQTGYWTFNLGTPKQSSDDLGILFLGPSGTTLITPSSTFTSLSTTLNSTTPILFNNYSQTLTPDSAYTYSTTLYLTKGLYYPILLYFSQNFGPTYSFNFSFFYGNYNPIITTNLKAYFHLNNSYIETISNTNYTTGTNIGFRNYNGITGIVCSGSTYNANSTNFIQNVTIPSLSLIAANGVSISLWFYPTDSTSEDRILISITNQVSDWNGGGFLIKVSSTNITFFYANYYLNNTGYAGNCSKTGLTISNNAWYHIVVTFDGVNKTGKIYLNNVDQSASSVNDNNGAAGVGVLNITSDSNLVSIGTLNTLSSAVAILPNFTGIISQVGIYNSVLTASEVALLYTSGFAPYAPLITDFTNYIVNPPIPDAPTLTSVTIAADKVVTFGYTSVSGYTYYAYFSTTSDMNTQIISDVLLSSNSVTVSALKDETTYYIAIKALNTTTEYYSAYSTIQTVIATLTPDAPTLTSVSIATSKDVTFRYTPVSGYNYNYYAYFSTTSNMTNVTISEVSIGTLSPTTVNIHDLQNGTYYVAIKAKNATNFSAFSTPSISVIASFTPDAPVITRLSITPSTKTVNLTYMNTASNITNNYLYYSTTSTIDGNTSYIDVGTTNSYNNTVSGLVYGSIYYFAMKCKTSIGDSDFSIILGPYTMLDMTVPGLQWTSYNISNPSIDTLNPGLIANNDRPTFGNTFGNNIVNYFNTSTSKTVITSGNVTTLQVGTSVNNQNIAIFKNGLTHNVGVQFSGFFIPNKTGNWKFDIGTPKDAAILYLGPAGNIITDIIPTTPFLTSSFYPGFSTALDTRKPFLYNYAGTDIGIKKSSGTYDLSQNLSYPMLLYYTQYNSEYELKLTVTDPSNPSYPNGNAITNLNNLIYTPLPYAPILTKANVIALTKTVEIEYTKSSFTGGYAITNQIAYFSTASGSTFNVSIGNNIHGNYVGVVSNILYGNTYNVAIQSINIVGNSVLSNSISTGLIIRVPGAPTLTEVSISPQKEVTITFTPSTLFTGSDIIATKIYFFSTNVINESNIISNLTASIGVTTSPISYTADNILYDTNYSVAITSINSAGESGYSGINSPDPITNTSALPYINNITPVDKKLILSFAPPGSTTGSIVGYQYAIKLNTDTVSVAEADYRPTTGLLSTTRSYEITTLTNGTLLINGQTYKIYLRVVTTADSTYAYSSPVNKTAIPYTVPTKPSSVTIVGNSITLNQIDVTFDLVNNGGSEYTGYSYSFGSGYTVITTNELNSVSSYTFSKSGLFYGQLYSVNIKLINKAGDSEPTTSSTSLTLSKVPDAPPINSITVGRKSNTIDILFSKPNTNGSEITSYEYSTYSTNDNDYTSTGSLDTNYSITNTKVNGTVVSIINGSSYLVRLRARNAAGPSSSTTAASSVIPYTVPGAPSNLQANLVAASNTVINVKWTTPVNNGNAITAYNYSINTGSYQVSDTISTGNTFSITGTIGLPYYVNVKVKNAAGYSDPATSNTVTPYDVPGAPEFITGIGSQQISLIITKPLTNGREIDYYEYSTNGTNYKSTGNANTSYIITTISVSPFTGLLNNQSYSITLRAHNEAGSSSPSPSQSVTPQPTPDAPIMTTIIGNGFITLNFTKPGSYGSTIDYYEYSIDGGNNYISTGTGTGNITTYTITGLTNGQSYNVVLRAHSLIGSGATSSDVLTPYTTPSAPIINNITLGDKTVTINFTAPNDGGKTIDNYYYSVDSLTTYTSILGTATSFTITNLINQKTYTIRLKAKNTAGDGPIAIANVTPYSASVNGTIAGSSLTLSGYIPSSSLNSYTTAVSYYINVINKINDGIGLVSISSNLTNYVSLYASYIIASGVGFTINSDERIKKNVEYLFPAKSLAFVNALKPCSFQYVDFMKGKTAKYGYLAQEVETVFPNQVYRNSEYIPNFYEIVRIEDSRKIMLTTKTTETLIAGTKLKFYDIQNTEVLREVKEIIDANSFMVTEAFPEGMESLFFYGQEVADFKSIDAKQMTTIILSALQEIHKIMEKQDTQIDELEKMIEDLRREWEECILMKNNL